MYIISEEVENWLNEMRIKNYIINEDLTVDVNSNVNISNMSLNNIPIKFGIVNGNFYCDNNKLTSLKGCPEVIHGSFYCSENKLINLESCPQVINDSFNCSYNRLTSLEGCPEKIGGNFYCHKNKLTSLQYFPKEINGNDIYIFKNKIKKEELVNFHCKIDYIQKIYSDFNDGGDKEEFLEKLNYYKSKKENELLKELSNNSNNIKLNKKL